MRNEGDASRLNVPLLIEEDPEERRGPVYYPPNDTRTTAKRSFLRSFGLCFGRLVVRIQGRYVVGFVLIYSLLTWGYLWYAVFAHYRMVSPYQDAAGSFGERLGKLLVVLWCHLVFTFYAVSYAFCLLCDPGYVPFGLRPSGYQDEPEQEEEEEEPEDEQVGEGRPRRVRRMPRICPACQCYKPARSHHCSFCRRCVLEMDHHCPYINNCVGKYNLKVFVLFLFYATLACFTGSALLLYRGIHFLSDSDWSFTVKTVFVDLVPIYCFLGVTASLGISCFFLLIRHIQLVLSGISVIENIVQANNSAIMEGRRSSKIANWRKVFGSNAALWLCPWPAEPKSHLTNYFRSWERRDAPSH
ncbi:Palmitoyltransferase [Balamuthia mandrillaris]